MDEDYARKLRAWLRAEPGTTPGRPEEEREWLRDVPAPAAGEQLPASEPTSGETRVPAPQPDADERWSVRGQLPEVAQPETDEEWVCPVIVLPVPRSSKENGCRMSDAEARSRWNHPSNWHRRRREGRETEEREPGSR